MLILLSVHVLAGGVRELQLGGNDMALLATKTNHKEETRVWALIILWGVVTLMAGYALWMKVAGF